MAHVEELCTKTLTDVAGLIKTKEISPEALTQAIFDRLWLRSLSTRHRAKSEIMKKATIGLVLLLIGLQSLSPGPAYAFRCGKRLVLVGDSTFDVRRKCGKPVSIDQRIIYRAVPEQSLDGSFLEPVFIPVVIDEWIYDFGPKRFMQKLSFEEGILRGLESLGYGN